MLFLLLVDFIGPSLFFLLLIFFLVHLSCRAQTVSEIIVDVLDENDTPPKFEKDSYSEFVSENAPVGTVIAELRATDADTPANTDLVYSFSANSVKGLSCDSYV